MSSRHVPVQAELLHWAMFVKLDRDIAEGTVQYNRFEIMARVYLKGDVAKCTTMTDLLTKLQNSGHIDVGKYDVLKDLLIHAELIETCGIVEKEEMKILEILNKTALPISSDSQVSISEATARDSPTADVAAREVNTNKAGSRSVAGSINIYGSPTNFSIQGDQINAAPSSAVKAESETFISRCKPNCRDFVETSLYNQARRKIEHSKCLLLLGGMGDGKTSIVEYIATHPMDEYMPISCKRAEEVKKYIGLVHGTEIKLLLVFDDPFGGSYILQTFVNEWVLFGNELTMCLTDHASNVHKFLFATRNTIWTECKQHLEKFPIFANTLEISSAYLTSEDKHKMMKKYIVMSNTTPLIRSTLDYIVQCIKPIAFGQCCKLMREAIARSEQRQEMDVSDLIQEIFERPLSFLQQQLLELASQEKDRYATLCLILLCDGSVPCDELSGTIDDATPYVKERIRIIADVCGCPHLTCGSLQDSAERLNGTYLLKVHDDSRTFEVYTFLHDSIHEAVTMHYGRLHVEQCLKYLKGDVLVKIIRPYNYKCEQEFAINVATKHYRTVAEMFTEKVLDDKGELDGVFGNPCVRDQEFQREWFDYLTQTSAETLGVRIVDALKMGCCMAGRPRTPEKLKAFSQSQNKYHQCILYYLAETGDEILLQHILAIPTRHRTRNCNCSEENKLPCPIEGATQVDRTEIFKSLLFSYTLNKDQVEEVVRVSSVCDSVNVLKAVMTSHKLNQDQVRMAINWASGADGVNVLKLMLSELEEHECDEIKDGLEEACLWGCLRVTGYLLKCSLPCVGDQCGCVGGLMDASKKGHTEIIRLIATSDHGAQINTTNENRVSPLHMSAYCLQSRAVEVLLESGADVNMTDQWGHTPLHAAVVRMYKSSADPGEQVMDRRRDVVETILSHRPNLIMTVDQWGRTALDIATHEGYKEIVALLGALEHNASSYLDRQHLAQSKKEIKEISTAYGYYNYGESDTEDDD